MKTALKIIGVVLIGIISFYYIKAELYERELKENSIRIIEEIERANKIRSLDSADRERRRRVEIARMRAGVNGAFTDMKPELSTSK